MLILFAAAFIRRAPTLFAPSFIESGSSDDQLMASAGKQRIGELPTQEHSSTSARRKSVTWLATSSRSLSMQIM